jgi:hypothetical protein
MIFLAPWSPPCCDALVAIPLAEMLSSHGTKAKEGASAWHIRELVGELVGCVGIGACPSEFKNARPSLLDALNMQSAFAGYGPTNKKNPR